MIKSYSMYKDANGLYDKYNPVLSFTETLAVVIDHDNPFVYAVISEYESDLILRLTYVSNGYISYGNESGCLAWVKLKDKITDTGYKKIALSPEFVVIRGGNVIFFSGARSFDTDFSICIETFKHK